MKKTSLFTALLALMISVNAQFTPTDSIDLGEDRSSHNYMEYGNVSLGSYTCDEDTIVSGDSTIRVGNGTGADSIVFYLSVTPNTNSLILEYKLPWSGGGVHPGISIEDTYTDTLSDKNCDSVLIKLNGTNTHTADGQIKVVVLDTMAGFAMDAQITHMKVYSGYVAPPPSSLPKKHSKKDINIMPNPNNGRFSIAFDDNQKHVVSLFNAQGLLIDKRIVQKSYFYQELDLAGGIYFLRTDTNTQKIIVF